MPLLLRPPSGMAGAVRSAGATCPSSTVVRLIVPLVLLALLGVACSAGGSEEAPTDLVAVGTEAWTGESAADPGVGGIGSAEAVDPTGQNPVLPGSAAPVDPTPPAMIPSLPPDERPEALPVAAGVAEMVAAMTVEEKVGQLFAVSVVGNDADAPSEAAQVSNRQLFGFATPAEVVRAYHLGGVAYLNHDLGVGTSNVADIGSVAGLSTGLQRAAAADTGIGLLIGADQEGGAVVRLREPATVFPAARRIGDTGDLALAQEVGQVTGGEALALGINWVYAPVADVNVNPANPVIGDRAFGTEPGRVTEFVRATARGLAAGGVLPTLKHFPGHGDTAIDSHSSLPTIDHDLETLRSVDLPPFGLAAQDPDRLSVMVGHLAVPALDPSGTPATLSRLIIDVLRTDLGFGGLVVTDAMNMGALAGFGDAGSLAVQAVQAGIDVVLMPTDLPVAYNGVLAAVGDGTLPMDVVDAAVTRILTTKQALGLLQAAQIAPGDPSVVGSAASQDVRDRLASLCGC